MCCCDKRVVLFVDEDDREILVIVFVLGIYDIVMYFVEVLDVINRIKNLVIFLSVKILFERFKVFEYVGFKDVLKLEDIFKERFEIKVEKEFVK